MAPDYGGQDEILFECRGAAALVTLNREKSLNALTHAMVLALEKALMAWENDETVSRVVIKAQGRAFCAGGDLLDIYRAGKAGNPPVGFFADEYRLDAYTGRYPKPIVALINGMVMGGGVGISVHGSHRVMSENAVFAMPEVGIGFFPDVGGSHFLPRLPDRFGHYLALTGRRVRWGDALSAGIATHAVPAAAHSALAAALEAEGDTGRIIQSFCDTPQPETDAETRRKIADWFSAETLEDMVGRVRAAANAGEETAVRIATDLDRNSPTSLAVAFRQLDEGARMSLDDCMHMEFRIVNRMLTGHDFYEGIRAAVVDKDKKPNWKPTRIADIKPPDIDAYFQPLGTRELALW